MSTDLDPGLPVVPVLALCAAYACALFLLLDAVIVAARGYGERTESALYALTFVVVLPASVAIALMLRRDFKTRVLGSSPSGLIAVSLEK